jgi:hypothetical protein
MPRAARLPYGDGAEHLALRTTKGGDCGITALCGVVA